MQTTLIHIALLLVLPFWALAVIQRTKAVFAGRRGQPLLQLWFDVAKLLRKGAVYGPHTTWLFRAGPIVALGAALVAGLLVPFHTTRGPLGFEGDVIALAYVLGLGRFFTMAAALDTGSSFEGMGASREASISALAEPALFLALAGICIPAGSASFAEAWRVLPGWADIAAQPQTLVAAIALFAVLLAENSRMPIDDPNTHLELTMVHEVMVLDHGGPDFGFILYGSAMKLLIFESLILHLLLPFSPDGGLWGIPLLIVGVTLLSIGIGLVESTVSRQRFARIPQILVGASILGAVGLLVRLAGGRL